MINTTKLTEKERQKVWHSYTPEQQQCLKRLRDLLAPGKNYKIERW